MKVELIDVRPWQTNAELFVAVKHTPGFIGRLFGKKPYIKNYYSNYGFEWYDDAGNRLAWPDKVYCLLDNHRKKNEAEKIFERIEALKQRYESE